MTRRRFDGRPLTWLVFAALVGVPSVQLTRMLRAQRLALADAPAPSRVQPAPSLASPPKPDSVVAAPPDSADPDPGPFRYAPVGPARTTIAAAAVSPSGRLVAVLDDSGEVTVWDVRSRKRISRFASAQRLPMRHVSPFVPSIAVEEPLGFGLRHAMVAIGGNDGSVRVWHAATAHLLLAAPHSAKDATTSARRRAPLVDAEISLEGGLLSVSSNGSLALWRKPQPTDDALVWMTRSPAGNVRDVDISPDGRMLAVASDAGVYLVNPRPDLRTWTAIDTAGRAAERVRFNPGGGVLAAIWSDGEIRVYSAVSHDRLKTMRFGGEGLARLLAFSPDGRMLAATDGNRVIQVWTIAIGAAPVALTAPRGPVQSMWFTPDGRGLVVASAGDRYLRSLPLPGVQ